VSLYEYTVKSEYSKAGIVSAVIKNNNWNSYFLFAIYYYPAV
jgi:hypothetical protein